MIDMARSVCGNDCEITIDTTDAHYWNYKVDPKKLDQSWRRMHMICFFRHQHFTGYQKKKDTKYSLFYRERVFSGKEYTDLLGTYSDHIAVEESMRKEFFEKIENAIDKHGGTITIFDTIDMQLARKKV